MDLIYCDLDINLNMYNVPKTYRKKLGDRFKECSFIYESEINNKNFSNVKIYWGNRLPNDFLRIFPNLKWIHFGSVGIDRFQKINNPEKEKIIVTNSQNSVTKGMYAHTLFQIFYLLRQGYLINRMRLLNSLSRENFDINYKNILNVNDLKVLIVGYGNIGSKLGSSLKQMGAQVNGIALTERKSKDGINIYKIDKLLDLVRTHNFVIGLLPFNTKLKGIFNKQVFDQMPINSYFINNGRASHVNEIDLCLALKKNLSGAAIDVFDMNKIPKKINILEIENLLVTPHIGAIDPSYWPSQIELFEYNLECFLDNNLSKMKNICNINIENE